MYVQKNRKPETPVEMPQKYLEIPSVEDAKELRDQKFRDIPDYGESKAQIFQAIDEYVQSKYSFPIYLYDKKGKHVFSLHFHAQAEAEEKGYTFERDERGCLLINVKK